MSYIECDADEELVRVLGFSRKEFTHLGGKFEICKRLEKTKNSIGLIEYDLGKSNPLYLTNCYLLEDKSEYAVKIHEHKFSRNKLVVLHNDLEDWILRVSKSNKVDVGDFGLENARDRMHRYMPGRLTNFRKLITHLDQIGTPQMEYLKSKLRNNR